ncbi:MAG: 30S ribosomal protein S16 [Pedosphaera sp.]|nr:30S ribosomal protein S16 [Pedosphaera sp.]
MAVTIRLKRIGKKNSPAFRVVVADSRSPRDGRFIEEIGNYSPMKSGENYTLKMDRVEYWLHCGAQPSDTVASFIRKAKRAVRAVAKK